MPASRRPGNRSPASTASPTCRMQASLVIWKKPTEFCLRFRFMKAMARRLAPATRTTVRRSQALYAKTPHRSTTRMPAAVKAIWQLVRKIMWSNRCCATSHLLTSTTAQLTAGSLHREHERHAQRRAEDARALAVFVEPGARTHRLRRAQDDKCFYRMPLLSAAGSCLARILTLVSSTFE